MPKKEQTITVKGCDKERIVAISYSALQQLNWDIAYAGCDQLIGYTPQSWKSSGQQIMARASDGQLTVSSEMNKGESFDAWGRNRKHIETFLAAFESCKNAITETTIEQNTAAINALRVKTIAVAQQQQKDA